MASSWPVHEAIYAESVYEPHQGNIGYFEEVQYRPGPQYAESHHHLASRQPQPQPQWPYRQLEHDTAFLAPESRLGPPVFFTVQRPESHLAPYLPAGSDRSFLKIAQHGPHQAPKETRQLVQDVYEHIGATEDMESDEQAAKSVKDHRATFRRRYPDSKHERILLSLVHPKSIDAEYDLDDVALKSIFSAVNAVFFYGRLTNRVDWAWSKDSDPEYETQTIGHTSFRRAKHGGYETFVTLSSSILKDPKFNRRLLISAFIHELIHCYLFICCGFEARRHGGHTDGFHRIAQIIDTWAGRGTLHLCDMEADLDHFLVGSQIRTNQRSPSPSTYYLRRELEHDIPYYPTTAVSHNGGTCWEQHKQCYYDRWDYRVEPVARA